MSSLILPIWEVAIIGAICCTFMYFLTEYTRMKRTMYKIESTRRRKEMERDVETARKRRERSEGQVEFGMNLLRNVASSDLVRNFMNRTLVHAYNEPDVNSNVQEHTDVDKRQQDSNVNERQQDHNVDQRNHDLLNVACDAISSAFKSHSSTKETDQTTMHNSEYNSRSNVRYGAYDTQPNRCL